MSQKIPCLPYPGGKGRMAKHIVAYAPKTGQQYVEPFAGRGNVFWTAANLCKFDTWWLNDTATIPFFEALQSDGDTVLVPERTKELYYKLREAYDKDDKTAILLEPYITFSGGGYKNGGPGWSKKSQTAATYQRKMRDCHEMIP